MKQIQMSGKIGWKQSDKPVKMKVLSALSGRDEYWLRFGRMTRNEIAGVAALEKQCFSQPWSQRVLESELENPNAVFFVAKCGAQVAGYVGMHRVLDEGYIANVAVDEGFRRRGVATALLKRLFAFARREKLGFVTLEVRESNEAAVAFYRKLGFGEVGRRKNFYAAPVEDAVLMTAFLTQESWAK